MWPWLLTIGSKLLPYVKFWKIGVMLVALAVAGYGGYKLGQAKYIAKHAAELRATILYYEEQAEKNREINSDLREEIAVVRSTERVIVEEIIRYVEANPDRVDCELDADGLRLWNSSGKTSVSD